MTIQDADKEFYRRVLKDSRLMEIRSRIRHGTATFADTAEYNDRASTILGDLLSGQMPSTPDGERAKLCKYMLRHLYDDTNEMCTAVQQTLDKAQGLHLAPQKAPFPTERVQAIAGSLEDKTVPMETTQRRARSSATVGRSFHDDRMKAEADFRSRTGLKCYIVRNGGAKCCEWCAAMVGRYAYGDEPGDVYRRHDNCSCTVTYESGRQRQDVWSKRTWEAPAEGAGADALTVFTDETRPEGAAETVRLTAQQAAALEAQHPVISFTPKQAKSLQDSILTNSAKRGTMDTNDESDFFHRIVNAVTGRAYLNVISDFEESISLCEREDVRALLTAAHNSVQYAKSDSNRSKFNYRKNTVYLAGTTTTSTVAHELFHKIDYENRVSKSGRLTGCIQSDYTELMRKAAEREQSLPEMLFSLYPDAFAAHDRLAEEYRGISDIISGMTNGSVFLGYKHDKDYWSRPLALEKETFAQYGRMLFESNPEVIDFLREMFPETTEQIDRIITEINGQGE